MAPPYVGMVFTISRSAVNGAFTFWPVVNQSLTPANTFAIGESKRPMQSIVMHAQQVRKAQRLSSHARDNQPCGGRFCLSYIDAGRPASVCEAQGHFSVRIELSNLLQYQLLTSTSPKCKSQPQPRCKLSALLDRLPLSPSGAL